MIVTDYLLVTGRAVMSVIIIWAVVASEYDLRTSYARVKGWWARASARAAASVFLGLIALSEGLHLFNLTTGTWSVPDPRSLLSAAPWSFLCVWTLLVRPFGRYEVLCPHKEVCPVVASQGAERAARDHDSERYPLPIMTGSKTHAVPVAVHRREGA